MATRRRRPSNLIRLLRARNKLLLCDWELSLVRQYDHSLGWFFFSVIIFSIIEGESRVSNPHQYFFKERKDGKNGGKEERKEGREWEKTNYNWVNLMLTEMYVFMPWLLVPRVHSGVPRAHSSHRLGALRHAYLLHCSVTLSKSLPCLIFLICEMGLRTFI